MKETQYSTAVRLELIRQLQSTAMKMFKCLEGEETARCLRMPKLKEKIMMF